MDASFQSQYHSALAFGVPSTPDAAFRLSALLQAVGSDADSGDLPSLAPVWHDMDMLDHLAHSGELPITLLSLPAYAHVQDRYRLLSCGARFGEGYGAMIVTYNPLSPIQLHQASIGVSGLRNSGFLALSLFLPQTFAPTLLPAERLREAVVQGEVEAALLTGEEQLTHQALGLYNVLDLGAWWQEQTGLPLPLEAVAVRRDVPEMMQLQLARAIRRSVQAGMGEREAALDFALSHARKLDRESADSYIAQYVTEQSVEMGQEGRLAIQTLLQRGAERGLIPAVNTLDILDARD